MRCHVFNTEISTPSQLSTWTKRIKKTTFKIDNEDDFIDKNIEYYIEGKITPTDAKNTYNSKSNIKMVDNFMAHVSSDRS